MSLRFCLLPIAIVLGGTIDVGLAYAQTPEGSSFCSASNEAVIERALQVSEPSAFERSAVDTVAKAPAPATPSNADTATSGENGGPQVAGLSSRARVLALATSAGLVDRSGGALALTITPFSWIALLDRRVLEDQSEYRRYDRWRRFSGKVTLGGSGEAFDRDADGDVDEGLPAESLGDIVSYELGWRFAGSRDRRDEAHWRRLREQTDSLLNELFNARVALGRHFLQVADDLLRERQALGMSSTAGDWQSEPCIALIGALRRKASVLQSEAVRGDEALKRFDSAARRWAAETDADFVMSVVASGTERRPAFGGDRRSVGLRAGWGFVPAALSSGSDVCATCRSTGQTLDLSLDYLRNELPNGSDELEGARLGARYEAKFREFPGFGWKDATLSFSAAIEKYSDVPAGMPDNVAKAAAGVSFKVSETVKVPFSITWANRSSLLGEQDEVIGHVGISYDLDALFDGRPN